MRAMAIDQYGPADVLHEDDLPRLPLGHHDVRIKIYASSVNPIDWKVRRGYLAERLPLKFPAILGWDAAGVIEETGSAVGTVKVGDAVFSRPSTQRPGTYAESVIVDESLVAPKPSRLTFIEAATIPLAGLTAWEALVVLAGVKPGQRVLIHGGAGGVGGYAIQLAKAEGAFVATTTGPTHLSYAKGLGADQVLDYQREPFEHACGNMDVVLDTVGGVVQDKSYGVLKSGGMLVSIAAPPDPTTALHKGVIAKWFFLEPDGQKLRALGRVFEDGLMRPTVGTRYALRDVARAHQESEAGHVEGKIAIVVDEAHVDRTR